MKAETFYDWAKAIANDDDDEASVNHQKGIVIAVETIEIAFESLQSNPELKKFCNDGTLLIGMAYHVKKIISLYPPEQVEIALAAFCSLINGKKN